MLELPGRLERSTLGDVLGALHRSGATGALQIDEVGPDGSRQHLIYLRDGLIACVESGSAPAAVRHMPPERKQHCLEQLEALFGLTHARLSFRVMGQQRERTPEPLEPPEFLHGRQRRRDAATREVCSRDAGRERALALLGLSGDPTPEAIRASFRQLARRWHPDRHPDAGELTRAALCRRFAQISTAYRALMDASAEPAAHAANAR
ncbi:MAG: DnaJ domain-containing protein [Deltaproteobacteria bacterium]